MSKKNLNYTDAMLELEEILNGLENNELSIDVLTEKAKRAAELIEFCRTKLKGTENELKKINESLDSTE